MNSFLQLLIAGDKSVMQCNLLGQYKREKRRTRERESYAYLWPMTHHMNLYDVKVLFLNNQG